ncbi:MAG: hypothetical protein IKA23_09600 [Akkermansia sp.]|nr:hypothetical protein [Akkermansia sp.]MBR2314293.1 hypothetical protein [Akkermansia sp.]
MFQRCLLILMMICGLNSCISFNTGARLDSIGKAVPTCGNLEEPQYYLLNGVPYKEELVEYKQQNPKLVGIAVAHYVDTVNSPVPAPDYIGAPGPELYLARLDETRTDMPAFIRAIQFDYASAEKVDKEQIASPYLPHSAFQHMDALTLMPSLYKRHGALKELPTIRTTGNKIRTPLVALLSYGVDAPLTAVGYAVGSAALVLMLPFAIL